MVNSRFQALWTGESGDQHVLRQGCVVTGTAGEETTTRSQLSANGSTLRFPQSSNQAPPSGFEFGSTVWQLYRE